MNLNAEQIAELLAGIARSQQAIVDAIESETGGWRNTHLLPKLNTASNMRLATPRLIDIPSRILLRSQGRVPMDVPNIVRLIQEALGQSAVAAPTPASAPTTTAVAGGTAASVPVDPNNNELGDFFDS
ncbi:MAG: hypothetical protein ABI583_00275 [Betaproteobacteria bacterium]